MENKICIITGANAGIGKEAAIQIASKGHKVILGCRNKLRGEAALHEVKQKSKNNSVELFRVDMSIQESIREFSELIKRKYDKIDVLIHNAAAFDLSQKRPLITSENIESIWATNHVGPVLLSNLLLNKIKNSDQGRIITIASQGLAFQPKLSINFDDPEFRKNKFSVPKAYYQSKLAQIMYTYWLADELKSTKVTVNCIRVTNVKIDINRYPNIPFLFRLAYKIKGSFSISPDEMAETYAYLTLEPKIRNLTGKYFDQKKEIVKSSAYSYKKENIEKLIDLTNKYILNI